MARHRNRAKMNIPMCLAGVLLCLTLFSIHLSSGVVARYSTNTDGSDSARVISFKALTVENVALADDIVIPGVNLSWAPTVSFGGSESATYVFLEVSLTNGGDNWTVSADGKIYSALYHDSDNNGSADAPGLTWNLAAGWTHVDGTANPYVYYRALSPNDPLDEVGIVQDGTITVAPTLLADDLAKIQDAGDSLGMTLAASVVQSNGFASVDEAWKSLELNHARTP